MREEKKVKRRKNERRFFKSEVGDELNFICFMSHLTHHNGLASFCGHAFFPESRPAVTGWWFRILVPKLRFTKLAEGINLFSSAHHLAVTPHAVSHLAASRNTLHGHLINAAALLETPAEFPGLWTPLDHTTGVWRFICCSKNRWGCTERWIAPSWVWQSSGWGCLPALDIRKWELATWSMKSITQL